jgi:hypothetical protein
VDADSLAQAAALLRERNTIDAELAGSSNGRWHQAISQQAEQLKLFAPWRRSSDFWLGALGAHRRPNCG